MGIKSNKKSGIVIYASLLIQFFSKLIMALASLTHETGGQHLRGSHYVYVNNATSVEVWTVMAYICAMQAISLNVEVGYAGGSYEISNQSKKENS